MKSIAKSKKVSYWIIIYFIIFMIINMYRPLFSYATTSGKVYLTGNKDAIETGEEIEITLHIQNNKTAAYNANLYFDNEKMEYLSGPENTNIVGNHIIVVWYDSQGGAGAKQGELSKFVFRAKQKGLANFAIEGKFYTQEGQRIQTNFEGIPIQIGKEETKLAKEEQATNTKKDNANLQILRINQEGLVPSFEPDVYQYYLVVPSNIKEIEVLPIAQNPNATIETIGNTNLKEKINSIEIHVTSEDKTKSNIYTIQVTKTSNLELANTNLETLAIENVLFNTPFTNNTTHYEAEVSNSVENLNILAIPEDDKATVKIMGKENVKTGNNLVRVIVTAQDGFTQKEFVINVYKRNEEDENKHQEEQSQLQEKLEQAYEIEKVSADIEKQEDISSEQKSEHQTNFIGGIIIVIILIVILAGIYIIKRKNKN